MMNQDREPADDAGEAQLAWLLTSAYAGPELREEFSRSLSAKLDSELATAGQAAVVAQSRNGHASVKIAPGASQNGHLSNGHSSNGYSSNGHATLAAAPPQVASAMVTRATPRRRLRRWTVGLAVAASLLVAMAVWSNPPAWANMIRAIVSTIERYAIGVGGGEPTVIVEGNELTDAPAEPALEVQPADPAAILDEIAKVDVPKPEDFASATSATRLPKSPPPAVKATPAWSPPETPLPEDELTARINDQLAEFWAKSGISPVGPASDAEFMRRVYLDLTGRVPSVTEAREFLVDPAPDRREQLVDRLLAHHDHATHFAAAWRRILLPDEVDLSRLGGAAEFEEWLAERFAANLPYDEIVRELLLAEGRVSESGPLLFYAAVRLNPEELAARTSRAFLGVRMECAQCHDHPFDDVSQQDFWSFAAFFARISRPRGKMEMTSPVLAVRDNSFGDVMIPDSEEVVPPRLPGTIDELADDDEGISRREQLVEWLTDRHNQQFAQATVNRVWAHLFGRGLVDPVDDMRPANPPICPELLETLSGEFAAGGYDLERLCRALVLTDAYQLASGAAESDPSRNLTFAQMNMKSLTAEQLYDCIMTATGRNSLAAGPADDRGLVRTADMNRQQFIEQFRTPPGQVTDYQAGIPQALTMMHGGLIHNATDVAASGLLKSLAAPFFNDQQRLDTLYLATLSRYPDDEEREMIVKELATATTTDERQQVLGDVLWALLNSAEFTLNH